MTDMTDHDAARLAEIRARDAEPMRNADTHAIARSDRRVLLTMLDAAARPHDASFVTRAMFDQERCRAEVAETSAANLAAALAASEAKLGQARKDIQAVHEHAAWRKRAEEAETELAKTQQP